MSRKPDRSPQAPGVATATAGRARTPPAAWAALAAALVLLGAFGAFEPYDYDLPLHLITGEQLLQDRSTFGREIFSFTFPDYEWLNDKWLENVLVHQVNAAAGAAGLVLLRVALVLGMALLAWRAMEAWPGADAESGAAGRLAPVIALSLLPLVAYERFTLRPELFTLALLPAVLWIAARDRRTRGEWITVAVLFALWVNLHGYWFVGTLALGALFAGDLIEIAAARLGWGTWEEEDVRRRAMHRGKLLAAAFAGALVSPRPLDLFLNPFRVLLFVGEERGALETISELRSPFAPELTRNLAIWFFYLAAVLVVGVLVARLTRARPGHVILTVGFLAMACVWRRNIGMFAVVCAISVVWMLRSGAGTTPRLLALRRLAPATLLLIAGLDLAGAWAVLTDRFYLADGTSRRTGLSMSVYTYTAGLADFLLRERPPGRFFNDFASGSYLAYRLYPQHLIYIAGNTFKYPPAFFDEYSLVSLGGDAYKRVVEKYELDGFALQYMATDMMPLAQRLFNDPDYVPCYFDDNALFFARRSPAMDSFIATHAVDFKAVALARRAAPLPPAPSGPLAAHPDPRGELNRATFLHRVAAYPLAEVEYRRATQIDPSIPEAWEGLGEVILGQSRFQEALDILAPLSEEIPGNAHLVRDLARGHSGLGTAAAASADFSTARAELEEALHSIDRARAMNPDGDPMTVLEANNRFNLGYALWRQSTEGGDPGGSLAARIDRELQRAVELQPGDAPLRYRVARIRAHQGRTADALDLLEGAITDRPDLAGQAAQDPAFQSLHGQPRFDLLARGG